MNTHIYLLLLLVVVIVIVGLMYWTLKSLLYMFPMAFGAVFVPSANDKLTTMMQLAAIKPGEKVVDLGSGDGKVMLAAARAGAKVTGIEINPLLVRQARKSLRRARFADTTTVIQGNMWDHDLVDYDVVFIYGTTYIMKKLEKKLQAEAKPGTRVISNYFELPTLTPQKIKNQIRLYVIE